MNKKIILTLSLGILFLLPSLSLAECTAIGSFNRFVLEGANTVILYLGSTPVVTFDVMDCSVQPTSTIELIKSDVCDGNDILIDGSKCTMMEIKPSGR